MGGDKSDNWKGWYDENIPIADDRFDEHQAELAKVRAKTTTGKTPQSRKKNKGAAKMSLKQWEKKVLEPLGAGERVREVEYELRLAAGLTALREKAGMSQRELAERIGVSQPRVAAIERSRNVTIDVLEQYVGALGGHLEMSVVQGRQRTSLLGSKTSQPAAASKPSTKRAADAKESRR